MGNPIMKTGIVFNDLRIVREQQLDLSYTWYVDVQYRVLTDEGLDFPRSKRIELTGVKLATAKNYLIAIRDDIKAEEGVA